jgi:hypothetical protein
VYLYKLKVTASVAATTGESGSGETTNVFETIEKLAIVR